MMIQRVACGVVLAAVAACGDGGTAFDAAPDFFADAPRDAVTSCAPLAAAGQQGCSVGEKCGWIRVQDTPAIVGQVGCTVDGARQIGEACARGDAGTATGYDDCALGGICVGDGNAAVCMALCDPAAVTSTCTPSETCATYPGVGGDGSPGMPSLGACAPS